MANDQFLESQRQMMIDMRRMQTVLTSEQQRQIAGKYAFPFPEVSDYVLGIISTSIYFKLNY